jgi:hypothetical protein
LLQARIGTHYRDALARGDGLITNDKFCISRFGKLKLQHWRRPLRLRSSTLLETEQTGGSHGSETQDYWNRCMDNPPTNDPAERRAAAMGPGLSVPSAMERGDSPIHGNPGGEG